MRRAPMVAVVVAVGALSACSGSADPAAVSRAEERATAARAEATTLYPAIGAAVRALSYTSGGVGRWEICGMEPTPSGAEYVVEVAVQQADSGSGEQGDLIAGALTAAGWSVERPATDTVEATDGDLGFRSTYGGAVNLSLRSGCIEVPVDVVRTLTDRAPDDLGLDLPTGG